MSIQNNLTAIKKNIGAAQLVAVTKYATAEQIRELIVAGQKVLGESRVQDAQKKCELFQNQQIEWHMIGHLQSNKAKVAVKIFDFIQSVDSIALAEVLNKEAEKISKIQKILIQVNIGQEPQKSGVDPAQTEILIKEIKNLKNLELCGLMAIAPLFDDPEKVRPYFKKMRSLFDQISSSHPELNNFKLLSMGMSQDYPLAVAEGANLVRIGSALFA